MNPRLVIEFHYADGDVGAHPEDSKTALDLWRQFAESRAGHEPQHIVLRLWEESDG